MPVKPLIVAFVVLSCWQDAAGATEACADLSADAPTVRLAGLDAAGDPVLSDGRALRLVGLAPRQNPAEAERFGAEIARWRDRDLRLVAAGAPDRWGRLPVRLLAVADGAEADPRDLATLMIESGSASRLPEIAHSGCGVSARAVRQLPKKAGPRQAVAAPVLAAAAGLLDGHDVAALKAHAGRRDRDVTEGLARDAGCRLDRRRAGR